MKVSVFLPSYLTPETGGDHARQLLRFAAHAEELGFEALFVTDHLLTARRFYRVGWTESLLTLTHAAAVTQRIGLGTSILVLPTRHPVLLAKQIATLQHLSGGRFIFGVGTGWYGPEFEATGGARAQRGRRTDEVLEATMRLLRGGEHSYEGRHYRFHNIAIEPVAKVPPVWVAGGRQYEHAASPEGPTMVPAVLDRICRWDGWIARTTASDEQIAMDLRDIDAELARRGRDRRARERGFAVANESFCWISESGRRADVVAEQQRRMRAVISDERPWDYIETVYLTGTIDEIQRRIQYRVDAGIEHLLLHTMTPDLGQLDLFARHILEPFRDVRAGPRRAAALGEAGR